MAYSYTRQSSMSDGDTITAALFNNEYNQLVNAFAYSSSSAGSTGHRHDGTAGHGGNIHTIGDLDFLNKIVADSTNNRWGVFVEVSSAAVEQIRISDGVISPVTDNDIDLGTSSLEFKDLFIDGTAHVDTLDVDVNGTVAGTFGVTGATTLSSTLAVTGAITGSSTLQGTTITATTAFVPDASDGAALGTSALEFSDLFLADGAVINFGDDQDVSLTHVADTGLLLSSTDQLQFGDSGTYIYQSADGVLDLVSDTEIELTATTIDINGAVAMDGAITGGTNITISGELDAATLDISGNADIDGTLEADAYTVDGTALNEYIADTVGAMVSSNTETNITVTYEDGDNTLDFVIGTLNQDTTGTADNITISANNSTDETVYPIFVDGATGSQGAESDTGLTYNPSSGLLTISGELDAGSLDISGNADIDGTLEADAYTVDGTALNEYIADTVGAMVGSNTETNITVTYEDGDNTLDFVIGTLNQDTTGTADNITISANNSTDETVYPIFVDGATGSQGAESDTGLTYNPSSGLLTSTLFAGTLNTAAQGNVTSLGTLTTLTVDNVIINGTTIGHTSDTDLITLADGNVTIAGELDLTTLDVSGNADIDGTLEADAITVDGTTLAEYIADTAGAMFSSNTESGITVTYQDGDNTVDLAVDAAQTGITSIYATDLILGEDSQTAIDFGTANEIDFKADNAARLTLTSSALYPVTDNEIDLGTSSLEFKDAFFDGTVTSDAFAGPLTGDVTGTADLATSVTVSANNSTDETVYPVFVDGATGSQGAETDTGFTYNPSSGLLTIAGELDAGSLDISGNVDVDGTLETDNLTVGGAQGSDGQVLTSTGSGVAWENAASGGASDLDGLSDAKTFGTGSIMLGDATTGTISGANYNTGLGIDVFAALTTGDKNTVMGYQALDANTTGEDNTAIGVDALGANTTGGLNTALGVNALRDNTTASNNTAVGMNSLLVNTTGTGNTAIGVQALDAATTANYNTAMGHVALTSNTSGTENTGIGSQAMYANTTGSNNTGIGSQALYANTTGAGNTALGYQCLDANTTADGNTAVGNIALTANTTGTGNVAVGSTALDANTTGDYNTAIGFNALGANTTANDNTAIGRDALRVNTTGASNTAYGNNTLYSNSTASNNTAVGKNALLSNTTGASNVAVGTLALDANTTADNNTAMGYAALGANTTGTANVAVGKSALAANVTANNNTAVGYNALTLATYGNNTAVGAYCLDSLTSALSNTAVGIAAGAAITTGASNTAIGTYALSTNTAGANSVAIGYYALKNQNSTVSNVAVGWSALENLTSGTESVSVGIGAGRNTTTGNYNVNLGHSAGDVVTTGGHNICIGYGTDPSASGANTQNVIGFSLTGTANDRTHIGSSGGHVYNDFTSNNTWTQTSDKRLKKNINDDTLGLAFINELNPVTFNWKPQAEVDPEFQATRLNKGEKDTETLIHGLLAQDVKEAMNKVGNTTFNGWDETVDGQSVSREMFITPLINAIKELSAKVEDLEKQLNNKE